MLCDPGTDCADCGPFRFNASVGNEASYQADLPVRRLRLEQVPSLLLPQSRPSVTNLAIGRLCPSKSFYMPASIKGVTHDPEPVRAHHRGHSGGGAAERRVRASQIDVRLRPTNTVPSFLMPFTDPTLDVDVSGQMAGHAAVEMGLTQARSH